MNHVGFIIIFYISQINDNKLHINERKKNVYY